MVLEVDVEKRRISLGMKQCFENPWLIFADNHSLGDKVEGEVSSLTDFGMFVGLDGGIDGLIHLSDLSWTEKEDEAAKNYKKGQKVEAGILAMDAHKERISLGIKQLTEDHFETFAKDNPKGTKLVAKVTSIEEELINFLKLINFWELRYLQKLGAPARSQTDSLGEALTVPTKFVSIYGYLHVHLPAPTQQFQLGTTSTGQAYSKSENIKLFLRI